MKRDFLGHCVAQTVNRNDLEHDVMDVERTALDTDGYDIEQPFSNNNLVNNDDLDQDLDNDDTRIRGGGFDEEGGYAEPEMEENYDDEEPGAPKQLIEEDDSDLGLNGKVKQRWGRPDVVPFDPDEETINIQWLDIDMESGEPLTENPVSYIVFFFTLFKVM